MEGIKEMKMEGIEETKEVLGAMNELSLVVVKLLKDGFQPGADAMALVTAMMTKTELRDAIVKAVQGITKVPAEVKDINLSEGLELAMMQVTFVPQLINAFKKPAAPAA